MAQFPEVNKNKEKMPAKTVILSSQSADQLPNILNASHKHSKKTTTEDDHHDVVSTSTRRSKGKRRSLEQEDKDKPHLGRRKRTSQENARSSKDSEDGEATDDGMLAMKRVKTNKVKINPKKLGRQFSSGKTDNPLRKFLTKHILDAQSPAAATDIQLFWLYTVSLISRTAFMNCLTSSPCAFSSALAIQTAKRRLAANLQLVLYIKRRCKWFRTKIKIKCDFVRNHGWKLVLFWRCIQRRKAVVLLRRMLIDYESFRLPYVMLRYRVNAVHLQRYVRSFLEVTESRKRVLLMKWHKISAHMTAYLIPYLFEQKAKEEEMRKRRDRDKWQGVEIDAGVLPSLGARVNLITKRTAALQIQIHESEATIQKHRMEMFVKRNKKKKKQKNQSSSPLKLPPMSGHGDSGSHRDHHHHRTDSPTPKHGTHHEAHSKGGKHPHPHHPHGAGGGGGGGSSREEMDESRTISKIVSKFVYECRRTCKFVEHHKVVVREKKRKEGMTCEEAKRILTNAFAAQTFAEELSNTEVKLEKIRLMIFTGQPDLDFRLLVENYLRAQNDFELTQHCTEYDIFHKKK